MKFYTKKELNNILKLHKKWIDKEAGGVCANLSDADLSNTGLICANLRSVDLRHAILTCIDLTGANLRGAYLCGVNLSSAYLRSTSLKSAFLSGANLSFADLSDANLSNASLSHVNLSNADLTNINLTDIYLCDFIKNYWTQTTPIITKCPNLNAGKLFKVKKTGKFGFILPYQIFKGWNRGFLDGEVVEFEMSEEVEILE